MQDNGKYLVLRANRSYVSHSEDKGRRNALERVHRFIEAKFKGYEGFTTEGKDARMTIISLGGVTVKASFVNNYIDIVGLTEREAIDF